SVFTACAGSPATPSESERPPLAAPAQPAPSDGAASAAPLGPSGPVFVPELRDAALADPQAFAFLKELCTTAPHRLAGSAGAARAVEWGRTTMQRIGFDDVRLEPCTVPRWERGEREELVVVEPAAHAGERLAIVALGGSVATPPEGLEADVIGV